MASSYFSSISDWFSEQLSSLELDRRFAQLGGQAMAAKVAFWFGAGFVGGFLFKKYFRFFLFSLLMAVVLMAWLEFNGAISIDWDAVNALVGIDNTKEIEDVFTIVIEWIRLNVAWVISGTIGFWLGYRLG